jgi:hypothetical protein
MPHTSQEMFHEINNWILLQNKQIQTALLLTIYRVYVDAKLELIATELLEQTEQEDNK